jgi:hypothetical protein
LPVWNDGLAFIQYVGKGHHFAAIIDVVKKRIQQLGEAELAHTAVVLHQPAGPVVFWRRGRDAVTLVDLTRRLQVEVVNPQCFPEAIASSRSGYNLLCAELTDPRKMSIVALAIGP